MTELRKEKWERTLTALLRRVRKSRRLQEAKIETLLSTLDDESLAMIELLYRLLRPSVSSKVFPSCLVHCTYRHTVSVAI